MRLTLSFKKSDYDSNKRLLVWGTGRYGELTYFGLKKIGLAPDYFIDSFSTKQEYLGIPIIKPELIKSDDIVLIASINNFNYMLKQLKEKKVTYVYDVCDLISIEIDENLLSEYALAEKKQLFKYKAVVDNAAIKGLIIEHLEVVVTEKCTLRCKDCANLMQYYNKPENISKDEIIPYLDRLIQCVDYIVELRFLGGEPFLAESLIDLIKHYLECNKIGRIGIYTNGTVMPKSDLVQMLKNEKVAVHISDYGKISRRIKEIEEIFKRDNVNYYIQKYDKWYDLGSLDKRNYTFEEAEELYNICLSSKCRTFYRGKLYGCPRAAHGEKLGFFTNGYGDIVDFREGKSTDKLITELKEFLNRRCLNACLYCDGLSARSNEIKAALQVNNKSSK